MLLSLGTDHHPVVSWFDAPFTSLLLCLGYLKEDLVNRSELQHGSLSYAKGIILACGENSDTMSQSGELKHST